MGSDIHGAWGWNATCCAPVGARWPYGWVPPLSGSAYLPHLLVALGTLIGGGGTGPSYDRDDVTDEVNDYVGDEMADRWCRCVKVRYGVGEGECDRLRTRFFGRGERGNPLGERGDQLGRGDTW